MPNFRSCFSGTFLKLSLYIFIFFSFFSLQLAAKSHPKVKTSPREIFIVMENYPPNCYIENPPREISAADFKNSVLEKIHGHSQKDFILSAYHFEKKSDTYRLREKLDKGSLDKIKDILFSIGFLRASGFEIEIADAVFSTMGIHPNYREYPWARCIQMMKSGSSDAIFTIFKSSEREKYLYYPLEPTVFETNVLFKLKKSGIAFDGDLKKLKNYVIGVKTSTSYGKKFDEANYLKKEEVSFTESVIRLVENGRVDLGVGPVPLLKYLMKTDGSTDKFSLLQPQISQEPLYIAFSRKRELKKLSEEFSTELSKFKKTGKYKKIMKKYGITNP